MLTVMIVFTAASGGPVMYIRTVEMCVVCVASQTQIKLVFLLLSLLLYTQKFGDFIWLCYVCDIIYGLLWFLEICFRGR